MRTLIKPVGYDFRRLGNHMKCHFFSNWAKFYDPCRKVPPESGCSTPISKEMC